jgi:hypothetical protein
MVISRKLLRNLFLVTTLAVRGALVLTTNTVKIFQSALANLISRFQTWSQSFLKRFWQPDSFFKCRLALFVPLDCSLRHNSNVLSSTPYQWSAPYLRS